MWSIRREMEKRRCEKCGSSVLMEEPNYGEGKSGSTLICLICGDSIHLTDTGEIFEAVTKRTAGTAFRRGNA